MNIINRIGQRFNNALKNNKLTNLFNQAFFGMVGTTGGGYDNKGTTYVEEGYNVNSILYSIIQQQARKSSDIPYFIKKVDDEKKANQFNREIKRSNIQTPQAKIFIKSLEKKAFAENEEFLEMPLLKPNMFQSWSEFIGLYKTFLKLNGNVYIYMLMPEDGKNAGVPTAYYLLPSHLMNIVLVPNADLLIDESPVDYYKLIDGASFIDFPENTVVHIHYPNPNFDSTGASHLYGQSPLRSALKNLESSNEAMSQNIKTLKNSGVYGFLHGKTQPLTPEQGQELKDRLLEMDANPDRLGRIAGASTDMAFTRLSLTTKELMPFDYLNYDQKQLCNVLGWKDVLLNNSDSNNWDSVKEFKKSVITDDILPDLDLLERAFNNVILPLHEGYENTMLYFDASTLPEMQVDMTNLTRWLSQAFRDKAIDVNEYREALNYPLLEDADFDEFDTRTGVIPTPEMEEPDDLMVEGEKKNLIYKDINTKAGFDPNQPRQADGKWGSGGTSKDPCTLKGWFKDSKAVDENGEPKKFYHGTTHDFNEFSKEKGNPENDFGVGFYFSSSEDDVDMNYDSLEGADLTNRIQQLAERIASDEDLEYDDPEVIARATSQLSGGENRILEVYLSLQNPLILGGENETTFEFYYDEDTGDETGSYVDLVEAMRAVSSSYYEVDLSLAISDMFEGAGFDYGNATQVFSALKKSEGLTYLTNENGDLAIGEFLREVVEYMGFDGIIDNNVWNKFGRGKNIGGFSGQPMDGVYKDTQHAIAFNPTQIKATDNETFCEDNPDFTKSLFISGLNRKAKK